ncbi:putative siderophore transport system ATP-binding protein YusV [Corynebacterium ciconiae DSM 44920]|uniref:ABC transporter ATP-binding protein n=1 Tax=Corynebacterium ciconiae TaxID=227319 RepID=UPI000378A608|nr:ABC transporter ATP-binding protein [Corynebacterium ciconiae]WKD61957.1 putative siderophore transport system ATP-binding protein YusV [Corynebacterium ciconiae DSM 44920]
MSMSVTAKNLSVSYDKRVILNDLNVEFPAGKITTIIGPNGCGKSTLLRATARLMDASGTVTLGGHDISTMKRKALATRIAMLPQSPEAPSGLRVADLVSRGRHPHQRWYNQWSSTDEAEVEKALALTGSTELAERQVDELSGGQRQRVWISMVLAQDTEVLFLDEPTTYLDLSHSLEVLRLVRGLRGRTVVMVLHDLNLAVRYSDHLIVMKKGAIAAAGEPQAVITPELLREVFDLDALVVQDPATAGPLIVPKDDRPSTPTR